MKIPNIYKKSGSLYRIVFEDCTTSIFQKMYYCYLCWCAKFLIRRKNICDSYAVKRNRHKQL